MSELSEMHFEYEIQGYYRTLDLASSNNTFLNRLRLSDRQFWDFSQPFTTLLGKNGSGKTTVLRALAESVLVHLNDARNEPRSLVRSLSQSPVWAGGFVVKRTDPSELLHSDREPAVTLRTEIPRVLRDVMTMHNQLGLDWRNYIPIGSSAWEFYDSLYNFVSPYVPGSSNGASFAVQELFLQSGLVLLMPHQYVQKRAGMEANVHLVDLLPVRCAFNNEDSSSLHSHYQLLKKVFRDTVESLIDHEGSPLDIEVGEFAQLLEQIPILSQENEPVSSSKLTDSPLFNPWNLSGAFLWECEDAAFDLMTDAPDLILDWPTYDKQQTLDHPRYLTAAVDPWLLGYETENFLDGVYRCVTPETINPWQDGLRDEAMQDLRERQKEIDARARALLKDWDVIPKWNSQSFGSNEIASANFGLIEMAIKSNGVDTYGWVNDVTTRWVSRALQIAIVQTGNYSHLPRMLIWDEPELGLHPIAIRRLAEHVIPSLVAKGFKIIAATHSMVLASLSDQMYECERDSNNNAGIKRVSEFDLAKLEQLGFAKSDFLLSRSGFVLVEGKHDKLMIKALMKEQFEASRMELVSVDGISKVFSIKEAELLLHLNQPIRCVIDGGDRSQISTGDLADINHLLAKASWENLGDLQSKVDKIGEYSEGAEVKRFLQQLIEIAEAENKLEQLHVISIFMLRRHDIIRYLTPEELWEEKASGHGWGYFDAKYSSYVEKREQNRAELAKGHRNETRTMPKKIPEKKFFESRLKLPLDEATIKQAIEKMMDRALDPEFEELAEFLFGS